MCDVHNKAVVAIDGGWLVELDVNVFKKVIQPLNFACECSDNTIFCIRTRSEDCCLLFGFPRNKGFA